MEIPNIHSMYNFKWQPFSNGINFGSLGSKTGIKQIVNHLKKHKAISNKVCLLDTLSKYFGPDLFQYVPVTMSVAVKPGDSMKSVNEALKPFLRIFEMFGEACEGVKEVWRRGGGNEGVEMWNEENQKGGAIDSPNQKSPDYCMPLSHFSGNNFWVFKVSDLNRGRGIHIFNTAQQLLDLVKAYGIHRVDKVNLSIILQAKNHMNIFTHSKLQNDFIIYPNNKLIPELNTGLLMTNSKPNEQRRPGLLNSNLRERIGRNVTSDYNFIIQKYIERPFLIHGRKFDIRVWVLVSHTGK